MSPFPAVFSFYIYSMPFFIINYKNVHICASCQGPENEERKEDMKTLNTTAQKQQPKNEGTFVYALSDMNQSYESRKQQSSRSFVPFTGITESR